VRIAVRGVGCELAAATNTTAAHDKAAVATRAQSARHRRSWCSSNVIPAVPRSARRSFRSSRVPPLLPRPSVAPTTRRARCADLHRRV